MINMNLHQASTITGGTLIGKPIHFNGVSTDSRVDCSGKLFVAIKGENFDGEKFCQQAIENGAVAILVTHTTDVKMPQIVCENTLSALSILGKNWAKQCQTKIVAITGSNGKTTVKNMIHSILSVSHKCSATTGNLNNEIGVPLTLCRIDKADEFAVIEMGAAKVGDISWLVSLVNIHTAVITNVSKAHVSRFKTFENIVKEKGQIISNLSDNDFAVLPIDDSHFALWKENTISKVLSFGKNDNADVTIDSIANIQLPIAGKHNQMNAACATAIALSFNISQADIEIGLQKFKPASGRLEDLGFVDGNKIINDSYNANPTSVKAAIDVLTQIKGTTTLVLGDMAELGDESKKLHTSVGEYAENHKITNLLTIGELSKYASDSFKPHAKHFSGINSLHKYMSANWNTLGTILIKGSRSMHLENLVNKIFEKEKAA